MRGIGELRLTGGPIERSFEDEAIVIAGEVLG